jgi:hypothetical protein
MARAMGSTKKDDGTVAEEKYLCYCCGSSKHRSKFYSSTDPYNSVGVAIYCKDCIERIARNWNSNYKEFGDVTKQSCMAACERLDVPWLEEVWEISYNEVNNPSLKKPKTNMWASYAKNIKLPKYNGMRWRDGDLFRHGELNTPFDVQANALDENTEQYLTYKKNKKAVIGFVGWDPFEHYPREDELPLLYAQLLTFLDEETKNDGQKLNAVIQIVKLFNQAEKINRAIDELQTDTQKIIANTATVKTLREAASKAISDANALAKDNGISLNFNSNKSKGANTLSGKMKELVGIGLREAKINTYDIGTCEGMRQVALINEECRHKQIGYDENIAQEIKDIKVELVEKLTKERDEAVETARKLLLENKDLKDFLLEKKLVNEDYEVIDDE